MKVLKILLLLIVILAVGYASIGLLLRDPMFRAHTPFTFNQIIWIHDKSPLIETSSPEWIQLTEEHRKLLLSSLDAHTVDWNSTSHTGSDLVDSWGTPCIIETRMADRVTELRFRSAGSDRTFGSDDDITTTKRKRAEQDRGANALSRAAHD